MARETEHIKLDAGRLLEGVRAVLSDASKGFYVVADAPAATLVYFPWPPILEVLGVSAPLRLIISRNSTPGRGDAEISEAARRRIQHAGRFLGSSMVCSPKQTRVVLAGIRGR